MLVTSLFIGLFISFILFLLMASSSLGDIEMIIYSIYLLIALVISGSIFIVATINKHSSNK